MTKRPRLVVTWVCQQSELVGEAKAEPGKSAELAALDQHGEQCGCDGLVLLLDYALAGVA